MGMSLFLYLFHNKMSALLSDTHCVRYHGDKIKLLLADTLQEEKANLFLKYIASFCENKLLPMMERVQYNHSVTDTPCSPNPLSIMTSI